jgi:hypothetical protein
LDSVDLGGKMIYEATITESGLESIKESGMSASASVEASYGVGSGGASASMSSSSKSSNSNSNSDTDIKIKIFGGNPPPDGASTEEGFAQWSATVKEFPMPVRYSMSPISLLDELKDVKDEVDLAIEAYMVAKKGQAFDAELLSKDQAKKGKRRSLPKNKSIKSGESMFSPNGEVEARLQDDGNFILTYNGIQLWATNIYPGDKYAPYSLNFQSDANLVIYNKDGRAIWDTQTGSCLTHIPTTLKIQDDGNMVMYDKTNQPVWSSHTAGPAAGFASKKDDC